MGQKDPGHNRSEPQRMDRWTYEEIFLGQNKGLCRPSSCGSAKRDSQIQGLEHVSPGKSFEAVRDGHEGEGLKKPAQRSLPKTNPRILS